MLYVEFSQQSFEMIKPFGYIINIFSITTTSYADLVITWTPTPPLPWGGSFGGMEFSSWVLLKNIFGKSEVAQPHMD